MESSLVLHEALLKTYQATTKTLRKERTDHPQLAYWLMPLNMVRYHSRAMVKWYK